MQKKFYKAALYIRVSTREQVDKGYSIGEQEERLRSYCHAMGWDVLRVYADPGFSGAKLDRPGLRDLLDDVHGGRCDVVLVWKLDRLSRSQKDTLTLIEDEFLAHGVAFVSMNENFDTSTSFGRAMIGVLSVFAQLEREQIRERMAMGAEARARSGKWHGGGFDPIGYDYIDGRLIVNEYEAAQVREIFDLYVNKKWAVHKIQQHMAAHYSRPKKSGSGSWLFDSAINAVLNSPLYIGMISWKGEQYPGEHEPIISKELFEAAQRRRAETAWSPAGRQKSPFAASHLLSGLTFCGNCGARYFGKGAYSGTVNRRYVSYYICYSRAKTNKSMMRDPSCKNKTFPVGDLDKIVLDAVKKLAFDPLEVERLIAGAPGVVESEKTKRAILEARHSDLKKQVDRLISLCRLGGSLPIQEIAAQIEGLQDDIEKTERALDGLPEDVEPGFEDTAVRARELFASAAEVIDSGDFEATRELVHSLIDKIVINADGIDIFWSFAPAQEKAPE